MATDRYQQYSQDQVKFTRPSAPWVWQQPERPSSPGGVSFHGGAGGGGGGGVGAGQDDTGLGKSDDADRQKRIEAMLDSLENPYPGSGRDFNDGDAPPTIGSSGGSPVRAPVTPTPSGWSGSSALELPAV